MASGVAVLVLIVVMATTGCSHRRGSGMLMSPPPPPRYSDSTRTDTARRAEQTVDGQRRDLSERKRLPRSEPSAEVAARTTDVIPNAPKPVGSTWSVVTTPLPATTEGRTAAVEPVEQDDLAPQDSRTHRKVRALDIVLGSVGALCAILALRKRAREGSGAG